MKILVTGANGQLARCINDVRGILDSYTFLTREELDITKYEEIKNAVYKYDPDVIVNCAAFVNTDAAENDTQTAFDVNSVGPSYIADICKRKGIKFIHISTDYVFDGLKGSAYIESDKCAPLNIYGVSKYTGEKIVMDICNESIIIRTSWLYSEYGNNYFTKVIGLIEKTDKKMPFVYDQIGCPTYARNLAKFIVDDVIPNSKIIRGVFQYTDAGAISRYDFAKEIQDIYFRGTKDMIEPTESASACNPNVRRPKQCILSKANAIATFGAKLMYWRDGLKECIERYNQINEKQDS